MKVNKIKFYEAQGITLVAVIVFFSSLVGCSKFNSINTPKDRLSTAQIDVSLLGQMFAQAQYNGIASANTGEFEVIHVLY
ncbi:MAG TPA: hypothetical protein VK622_04820, partial [Puia sp.]|nr:hypothetical protein [Puia sp.]